MPVRRSAPLLLLALALAPSLACDEGATRGEVASPPSPGAEAPPADEAPELAAAAALPEASPAAPAADASPAADRDAATPPDPALLAGYPWLAQDEAALAGVADTLDRRFAAPPGFTRVDVDDGSFGAFLRTLPLRPAGTPVQSYAGATILPPKHPNLAAVAAIDVGERDLQQCADSIIRLHAEWKFARGERDHSYRSASGVALPFARYLKGERIVLVDKALEWRAKGAPRAASHAALRSYLNGVFAWANTGSVAQQAAKVKRDALRPGDFFVVPGGPGHAVLILDVAAAEDGRVALLIGQGFMPAQSFHVVRPSGAATPWFVVAPDDAGGVTTPFWATFPWSSLRRLDR
ncbi:MAG: DUF4846 domain-containing protein [Nannocystaceae bacterium]